MTIGESVLITFADQVVVVSGGARGIGRTIVDRFRAEGAQLVSLDLAFPAHESDDDGINRVVCDVTDPTSVTAAIGEVVRRFKRIDVLINNAGINVEGPVETLDPQRWKAAFDVNTFGTFLLAQAVIPTMNSQGRGRILNAASFAAIIPSIGAAAYGASKAAIVQFSRVLAGELGPWGITVNAYAPGMIPTAMNGFADMDEAAQSRLLDTLTVRRWETPDDVSNLLRFLASDAAAYITGTLHDVSGGKFATQIPARAYEGL